ncbi:PAS domain S-box protein [Rhodovulum sp. 12E13]|uniref:PAS domain-containing protein n=1 Tax=Rhodovulum sp. 12E13 TaxID=2203891 RepID=UPI000E188A63|nr:PAS domain-containing protein [Rhodovulum sp. 12E13]RDC71029.1 PAS domain S-box protein [Rhodovulum sp. 12E13]
MEDGLPVARFLAGIHEADRDRVAAAISRALETGESYHEEYRVRDASGENRWVTARGRCFHSLDGKPVRFPGVVADITEQIEARTRMAASEGALRQSEERRSRAMSAGRVGTFEFYPEENRVVWDPLTVEIFGFDKAENISLADVRAVIEPEDRAAWEADLQAALDPAGPGIHRVELRITRRQDGEMRWVEGRGQTTFEGGRATAMLGTLRDITERRRYEEQLRPLNRELRHRVKNLFGVIQGLILTSAKGAADLAEFVPALRARIDALAAAHLVGVADEQLAPVSLRDILDAVMKPYRGENSSMTADGPDLALPPRLVTPLGLVLHELATNAVKHGAWSVPHGRIAVEWSVSNAGKAPGLELAWQETLPEARAPCDAGGSGFGGRVIDASLTQVRGRIRRDWRADGLVVRLSMPLAQQEAA